MARTAVVLGSNVLLFILVAGLAGSCDPSTLRSKFKSGGRGIALGLTCQFVLLPLLGLLSVALFPQRVEYVIALLIVTTAPGGGFSGWWCSLCNADLALSIAMTTASTLVCMVALPLNIILYVEVIYGSRVQIAWYQLIASVIVVISAVATGILASVHLPNRRLTINRLGQIAGVALMVYGAALNGISTEPIWTNSPSWFAFVTLPCVLGLTLSLLGSRMLGLPNPEAVAVAIECCYQNTGLALTITMGAIAEEMVPVASGVPLMYGIAEILLIAAFGTVASRLGWTYAPADEAPCLALARNYQPREASPRVGAQTERADTALAVGSPSSSAAFAVREHGTVPETPSPRIRSGAALQQRFDEIGVNK